MIYRFLLIAHIFIVLSNEYRDSATLRFCEAYAHEFPMSDTFKIVHSMMEKVLMNCLNLRQDFFGIDYKRDGWLDKNTFIKALDSWELSRNLNDQELITILRRFQFPLPAEQVSSHGNGDDHVYLYHEMCDLFSHIFTAQKNFGNRQTSQAGVDDMQSLLRFLRSRTTQVRGLFFLDNHVLFKSDFLT